MPDLYTATEAALLEADPSSKCRQVSVLRQSWREGGLALRNRGEILQLDDPGRPPQPELVDPRRLQRRSSATAEGRMRLLHAFAHIEFNAINIALDAVYRFREMPREFIDDWLKVADEEATHFGLISRELERRGSGYGAYSAHRGLWDMVCKTREDPLLRMALVPRVMEARGLDVSPSMIERFRQAGDEAAVAVLEIIYRDEIGHVRIGNRWFERLCRERGQQPEQTFRGLVDRFLDGRLRGPFNRAARIEAGFAAEELDALEAASGRD